MSWWFGNWKLRDAREIRTDNAGDLTSKAFKAWLRKEAIIHQTSGPHSSAQNEVAEHGIGVVEEGMRSMMDGALAKVNMEKRTNLRVQPSMWNEAACHYVHISSQLPATGL